MVVVDVVVVEVVVVVVVALGEIVKGMQIEQNLEYLLL